MDRELRTAYFAGLIDGEGYIGLRRRKNRITLQPWIKVNMTCLTTVTALSEHFGGNVRKRKTPPRNKPQWVWVLTCSKARVAVALIRPYLITKRDQADELLAYKGFVPKGKKK